MNRGKVIVSWAEPRSADKTARQLSKVEGTTRRRPFPWIHGWAATLLYGTLVAWKWHGAESSIRANLPPAILVLPAYFAALGIYSSLRRWHGFRRNRTTTTIYEAGISHGTRSKQQWIPWSGLAYFFVEEDQNESVRLRLLNWKEQGRKEEEFSILPDSLDTNQIISSFLANGIKQAAGPREA